jgi:hypothetical protein
MRLECEHAQRRAIFVRHRFRLRDQRLMAAMHAVEIANRDDSAFRAVRHVIMMAEDPHCALFKLSGALAP